MSEKFINNETQSRYDGRQERGIHIHSGCPECDVGQYNCATLSCVGEAKNEKICPNCWAKNHRSENPKKMQIGLSDEERDKRLKKIDAEDIGQTRRAA
jgi:hypothetical protein